MRVALRKAGDNTRERGGALGRWGWLKTRIWLPKFIYDAIPYFYFACGVSAFLATLYIAEWFWLLPHYLLFSFACVHMGIVVYRWRSKPKANDVERQQRERGGG